MGPSRTVLVFPINGVGHIHAVLAIADKLKRDLNCRTVFMTIGPTIDAVKDHGHELVVLAGDTSKNDQGDGAEGVKRVQVYMSKAQGILSADPMQSLLCIMNLAGSAMLGELIACESRVEQAIDEIDPDLIIIDHLVAPLCILKNKRPWVNVISYNPLLRMKAARADGVRPPGFLGAKLYTKSERQAMAAREPERWASQLSEWKELDTTVKSLFRDKWKDLLDFYEANGLPQDDVLPHSPHLNIYLCPKAMEYDCDDDILLYPPRYIGCDSLVRKPLGTQDLQQIQLWSKKLDEAMQGKKEMIYFSLGTMASARVDLLQRYIDYLKEDKERLYVVSKGAQGDKLQLSEDNMIGANFLPQTFFLERAKFVIVHGGNNGITESMYYGKPMIVLPMFGDQHDNARRVEELGFGCQLNLHSCTKQELLEAIEKLSADAELAERMKRIGERMRSNDDLDRICSLIRKLADDKSLSDEQVNSHRAP